jgi:hypothetical protein
MTNVLKFERGQAVIRVSLDVTNREETMQVQLGEQTMILNAWDAEELVLWLARQKENLYWLAHREEEEELDEDEIYPY